MSSIGLEFQFEIQIKTYNKLIRYVCNCIDGTLQKARGRFSVKMSFASIGIPITEIWRPHDRIVFIMKSLYLERLSLY